MRKSSKFKVKTVDQKSNKETDFNNSNFTHENEKPKFSASFKINLSLTQGDIKIESINNAIHEYLLKMNLHSTL